MELTYSDDQIVFNWLWTVQDLKNTIRYMIPEDQKNVDLNLVLSDSQIDELTKGVNEAVEQVIENFMNSYF